MQQRSPDTQMATKPAQAWPFAKPGPRPLASAAAAPYRPDIDGLRAIAVIPVVLFHFRVPGFGGGYVGVDVFFVISGFLISSLVYRGVPSRAFSLVQFYERRARRIFPALFVVVLFTAIV